MKKLERNQLKNVSGGMNEEDAVEETSGACITACGSHHQAACKLNSHKACSTGSGPYAWKCCST